MQDSSPTPPSPSETIDLLFPVVGRRVPADHGYHLYAAICGAVPEAHAAPWLGVHPLRGQLLVDGTVRLSGPAHLGLRLPVGFIPAMLPLAGRTLRLGADQLTIGAPQVRALAPSGSLDARLVSIRLTQVPRTPSGAIDKQAMKALFEKELRRQLEQLGAEAEIALTGRQEIAVGRQRILGWSVRLSQLDPEASLLLQARGLGGKRAMGCGIFLPTRGE